MVVVSRCLSSLALLLAGAEGARIQRKRGGSADEVTTDCYSKYDGQALLSLKPCDSASAVVAELHASGCFLVEEEEEIVARGCNEAEVVCPNEVAVALEGRQVASIVAKDAGEHWRASSGVTQPFTEGLGVASDFYSQWRDLDARMAHVESLVQASGGLATLETVGQSLQGRDLKIVRLRGAGYSSGGTRVVVTFNIHAREWIAGMSGIYTVEYLIQKLRDEPDYLAGTEVVLMPMSNPDGFIQSMNNDRMHRKNMRNVSSRCWGVDINRNFDAKWASGGSSNNPCSDTYHGTSAMSEPESKVIGSVLNEAPMTVYIDVHAFSQLIISAYGWTSATHPRNAEYRAIGGSIQAAIKGVGGNTWTEGAIAKTLYSASGSTVDYADDRGALGICFELRPGRFGGGGFAPPASQIIPGAEECFAGLLATIDYAKNPPATTLAPPGNCPWHGCRFGCGGGDCQYCERCQ